MGEGLFTGEWTIDKKQNELSTVLANILTVFRLIKDSLPGIQLDTPYIVDLAEEKEDEDETDPPKEVCFHNPSPEEPKPPPALPQNLDPPPHRPRRTIIKPARFRN